jgi:hypothetical protein
VKKIYFHFHLHIKERPLGQTGTPIVQAAHPEGGKVPGPQGYLQAAGGAGLPAAGGAQPCGVHGPEESRGRRSTGARQGGQGVGLLWLLSLTQAGFPPSQGCPNPWKTTLFRDDPPTPPSGFSHPPKRDSSHLRAAQTPGKRLSLPRRVPPPSPLNSKISSPPPRGNKLSQNHFFSYQNQDRYQDVLILEVQ